jgi:regulatory protein
MASRDRLYGQALRFLAVRGRSRWEMHQYLERKSELPDDREAVIERLEAAGLIDDRVFAEYWIASRQSLRPRSKRRLAQELIAKRVPREVMDEAMAGVDDSAELSAVLAVASKKLKLARYQDTRKLQAYLLSQGFNFEGIKEALRRLGVSLR